MLPPSPSTRAKPSVASCPSPASATSPAGFFPSLEEYFSKKSLRYQTSEGHFSLVCCAIGPWSMLCRLSLGLIKKSVLKCSNISIQVSGLRVEPWLPDPEDSSLPLHLLSGTESTWSLPRIQSLLTFHLFHEYSSSTYSVRASFRCPGVKTGSMPALVGGDRYGSKCHTCKWK